MSLQTAIAALSIPEAPQNASKIDSNAPPLQNQEVSKGSDAPKTLESVIKPASPIKPPIGADRFAALAKQERAIRKQAADLKAREAKLKEYETLRSQVASNPLKAMEVLGITYDQLTQFLLNGQQPTPDLAVKAVKDEVEALKRQQAQEKQQAREAQKRAADRELNETISDFNSEIKGFLGSNKDQYELTNMYQGNEIVYATIEQHFANTKKIMSIKEAADLVEGYFEEQVRNAQKTKKFQGETKPKDAGQPRREAAVKPSSPTLTNELVSSAPSLLPAKTENDRLQRAMAALNKA